MGENNEKRIRRKKHKQERNANKKKTTKKKKNKTIYVFFSSFFPTFFLVGELVMTDTVGHLMDPLELVYGMNQIVDIMEKGGVLEIS